MHGAAHADDGADNGPIAVVIGQATHKRLVDLELVNGEFLQIGQARITGAEIVDRQTDAQLGQHAQTLLHLLRVLQQDGFRQLQFQQGGWQLVHRQEARDAVHEVGLAKLQR